MTPAPTTLLKAAMVACDVPAHFFDRSPLGHYYREPIYMEGRTKVARWMLDRGMTVREVMAAMDVRRSLVMRALTLYKRKSEQEKS